MRNSLVPTVLCALGVVVSPALAVAPGSSEFEKGRQAYYSKDYALAIHQFQLAARKTDRDPTVHYYLANALALTGNYEEARKQYQKSIQVGPSSEAGKLARVGLAGITSPTYGSFRSASFPAPGAVSQAPDEGQSVRQFVQALNNQLADRKRLATWEAEVASYNQIQSPYLEYYGYGGYSRRRYRHVMPMYNGFYGGNNYIGYANYGNYGSNYSNYNTTYSNYGGSWHHPHYSNVAGYGGRRGYSFAPDFYGNQELGFNFRAMGPGLSSYGFQSNQKIMALEQAASGLESQMLSNAGSVKINPRGTNLYIRNYGSGVVPEYQPPPVIELLARQEKLVIDDSNSASKLKQRMPGAKNATQEAHY